ncbi:MAG: DDE-type integrase/transposase/recombinase [Bacteroidia bacterium]|nr:DDE-type integrase/transposase/recombinase [Bacteroidia bacterium]
MTIPLLMFIHAQRSVHGVVMERFYDYYNITRQGFAKASKKLNEELRMMNLISQSIRDYRLYSDRRAGSRSLFYNLNIKAIYGMGVTRFERLMSKYGLTLLPIRTRVITTKSCLRSWNYPNLCNSLKINGINQLVVGDLTYISIGKNRYFMFCLTDVFSARIVGFCISNRMRSKEAFAAFNMWVKLRGLDNICNCIHHTDGGSQYFSTRYVKAMVDADLQISVAKSCLENGYAEQKNGVIKNHLIPTLRCSSTTGIRKAIHRMVDFYNHNRKQPQLGWKSPIQFESELSNQQTHGQLVLHDHEQNIASRRTGFFKVSNGQKSKPKNRVTKKV